MKYLSLVMSLLCLTALSRVQSMQELLEQTKDQYHLEQDIDTFKSILEGDLDIKKEKGTSNQLPSLVKGNQLSYQEDSIQQSILLAKGIKSEQNLTNSNYPNTTYNYTSSSNSSSNSSSQNTTNQNSTINYDNGSSNNHNPINSRYIPSRLQLKVRNHSKLQQGQIKNNTQNVTYYNSSSGTYEYVVIYNNTETQENNTESEYYYYQNSKVVTLERDYDDQGNVIYRNFNFNYSLIVAQKSTNSNFNENKSAFGTLVLTNQTISAAYKTNGYNNRLIENNNGDSDYENLVYDFNGKVVYSNQTGYYNYGYIGYGSNNQWQFNGSEQNIDEYRYDDLRGGHASIDRDQNASHRYSSQTLDQNEYQFYSNLTSGNNSSINHYRITDTKNITEKSNSEERNNDTISNFDYKYKSFKQSKSNGTSLRYKQYSASNDDELDTYLNTVYTDSTIDYDKNKTILNYNQTLNKTSGHYFDNTTIYSGASNQTYENVEGSKSRYAYDYGDHVSQYITGSNHGILNETNSEYTSGPNTTVTTLDSKVTTGGSYNYQGDLSGSSQTTHTQSTVEESKQNFNQLRGSKKQASGSWRQIETAELQQSNSLIIEDAIKEINIKFNPQQDGYQFDSVISVQEQIVSGINYKIYLNYSNPKFEQQIYEVIINSIPWQNSSNQVVKSARFDQIENWTINGWLQIKITKEFYKINLF
ncbi:unnamed protein product (macronuclear) [Paramecium tetraurelia]|uniref:CBM-cenC domain-containing protein n=1 Tax=Paramecium tetraurelia TaxID=5888 RepID=A0DF29_PARTE|nr:uncharacterized protein GSPATT00039464001 [Paramecium tetraurelia]CAK81646.1 unnamed protein product [Paramecium tetraurelia]|eukprot:XP_001449043.1 hypothetical protein (macronuclear) [Paramecium tetraurelia strain d4-2]